MDWIHEPCSRPNQQQLVQAQNHQLSLTKPPGSLGELERIACQFSAWQNRERPEMTKIRIRVFAGDHGVCAQNVSAFPQAVTTQMIANFCSGGAAISVLAEKLRANFLVVNLGTVEAGSYHPKLVNKPIAPGTYDFSSREAMSSEQLAAATRIGAEQVEEADHLFVAGDMGIGNTTSAAAIYAAVLNEAPDACVGPGTGVDQQGVARKAEVIKTAFALHGSQLTDAIGILRCVGGFEIAAMTGAYIRAAQLGVPILVDGYISTAAALAATQINPSVRDWMLFAHRSAEPAHIKALDYLNARPLLDLNMRLGEGSGAALAIPIIKDALLLHNNMATFESAGVSNE